MAGEMTCKSIQVGYGPASVRVGKCIDEEGYRYLDSGVGVGFGYGVYYLESHEPERDVIEPEARADFGIGEAGQGSTLGSGLGYGFGFGFHLGVRGLIPIGKRSVGVHTQPSR